MKSLRKLLCLCFLAVLASCSEDAFMPQSEVIIPDEGGSVDFISMTVPDIEIDATTRSKLYEDGDELKFTWQENDAIGVVPLSGNPLRFPIHAENAQKNTAVFDGGDWALKTSTKYAAFFPIGAKNQNTDIKHIQVDYTGQTQGNWMKYDFLATGAIQPKDGAVKFTMQRLSAILKIQVQLSSSSITTVRYATLVAPQPLFGVKGTLDLSGSEPVYTPEGLTKFINTDIGVSKSLPTATTFTLYLMIPPTDLSGTVLKFLLNSDSGTAKQATFTGQNYEAGKAYTINVIAYDAFIHNANLIEKAGLSSYATSGSLNAWVYRDRILEVKELDLSNLNDPTVCDEIGFFRNLETLKCNDNNLTYLDVSNNTALTYLDCSSNQLTSLDVSKNTALEQLVCYTNELTNLNISNNPALTNLQCLSNQLTSLDVSNNTALASLSCSVNQLTMLDVSNNTALTALYCNSNQLTSLDVSNNTALTNLQCNSNQLTLLDVSNNTALTKLKCNSNQLTSLDVSNNTALTNLECEFNQLTSLDVSNNTALTQLFCQENQLTSLDVSNNTALIYLYCNFNQLETFTVTNHSSLKIFDIANNPKLTSLDCSNNVITSLNINGCTALKSLDCNKNRLTALNISSFFPTLTRYNVFCGNQKDESGESQTMTLTHNAQDNSTFRETILRNWNVTLVAAE